MPTYQYRCTACGELHEAVQSFSDPSLTECPSCGGELRKVFSAVGVVFKGSGFYRNDSRSPAKVGASSSSAESTSSSGSSGSSDSGSSAKGSAEKGSGTTRSGDKASTGSSASTSSKSAGSSSSAA